MDETASIIATFVHATDHMHNHLRGLSFKKKKKNQKNKKACNKPFSEPEHLHCSPPKNSTL